MPAPNQYNPNLFPIGDGFGLFVFFDRYESIYFRNGVRRIYEDDISGAISHERFLKLSAEYEAEQKELTEKVKANREMVNTYEQDKAGFDSFAAVIRKYVGITELTPTIVNEFVKKIIVYAPDKSSGHRRQKIQIIWNFIGELKQDEDKQTIERERKSRAA